MSVICPLCAHSDTRGFLEREERRYHRCPRCALTFMDPADRLAPDAELARYRTHDNRADDPGYRAFLRRLADPLMARLPAGARGLDYGSGPGPTLSLILTENGFPTTNWDPFFDPDPAPLGNRYDFITCTETAEHFFEPGREFERLDGLLNPGGVLAVMTGILHPDMDFATWWYVRDPSHVAFYAPATLRWIARRHGWDVEEPAPTVVIFRKGLSSG